MALNFQLEFPTRRMRFGITNIAALERAGKNISIYVFCFFLRDSAYDNERAKRSVFYTIHLLHILIRPRFERSRLMRASAGRASVPPLSDSPRSAAIPPSRQLQARLLELWPFWPQLGGLPTTAAALLPHVRAIGLQYRHVPELLRGMGSPAIKGAPRREAPTGGAAAKRGQRLKKKKLVLFCILLLGAKIH